ncbi:MAG: mechanosensitive ion channel [Desulfobacteraceae bacterium]|jgi:small conductance mechanosensitive channel
MFDQMLQKLDVSAMMTKLVAYVPNLIAAVVLAGVFWVLVIITKRVLATTMRKARVPEEARDLMLRFVGYAVIIIALLTIASQLGIKITSLVAGLGIAGLALSFAAQETVANVISGITLLVDRPFKKDDWVCVGDMHASVSEVRLRTTVLTTFDNETVVMPNRMLARERIRNFTLTPRIRVRVPVGIAYKEKTQAAREVMLATTRGDERILDAPEPAVIVTGLGDSSVNLELRFWTEDSLMKYPLQWEYTERCKRALDEVGIEIPFPHRQIFLERSEGLAELVQAQTRS